MTRSRFRAFTLIELLIVVVILGVLAAIVVPQFAKATSDSAQTATFDQLARVRRAVSYYYATNNGALPVVTAGEGTWGAMIPDYMREVPRNFWVPPGNSRLIVIGASADAAYSADHGWIYNPATGDVWAGGFDQYDQAFPH